MARFGSANEHSDWETGPSRLHLRQRRPPDAQADRGDRPGRSLRRRARNLARRDGALPRALHQRTACPNSWRWWRQRDERSNDLPTQTSLRAAKEIFRVFHPAQHRQPQLGNGYLGHFVKQHEQHIAGYGFRELLNIFWRKVPQSWAAFAERESGRFYPPSARYGAGDRDGAGCANSGSAPDMSPKTESRATNWSSATHHGLAAPRQLRGCPFPTFWSSWSSSALASRHTAYGDRFLHRPCTSCRLRRTA